MKHSIFEKEVFELLDNCVSNGYTEILIEQGYSFTTEELRDGSSTCLENADFTEIEGVVALYFAKKGWI